MRLILGDNMVKPSIRDIILIGSLQQDLVMNRKMLKIIGRNNYSKIQCQLKYGGKFGDRLIKFGKNFYNKVVKPGYQKVIKPAYNVTKKLIDIAANNDFANTAIKLVGNTVGTALGAPGVGNMIANAAKAADKGLKIGENVVNKMIKEKKLDPNDILQIVNIVKDQIKEFKGKDKVSLEKKIENVKNNLQNIDLEKENLTKEEIKEGFNAGLIFYNPVNRQLIKKYAGRVGLGGSVKPLNPKLLRILPKILKSATRKTRQTKRPNFSVDISGPNNRKLENKDLLEEEGGRVFMSGRVGMGGRVKMSGGTDKSDLNSISSKLEALKSKYK